MKRNSSDKENVLQVMFVPFLNPVVVTLKVVVMLSITGLFSILSVMFVMLLRKRLSIPKP